MSKSLSDITQALTRRRRRFIDTTRRFRGQELGVRGKRETERKRKNTKFGVRSSGGVRVLVYGRV